MIAPGSLNTFVFDDRNNDGSHQGEGGLGVEGVTVELVESDGSTPVNYPAWFGKIGRVPAAETDEDGKASFDFVPADRPLKLKYSLTEGLSFTGKFGAISNDKNNDAKGDGTTEVFQLAFGSEVINYVEAGVLVSSTAVDMGDMTFIRADETSLEGIRLYPNPVSSNLTIQFPENELDPKKIIFYNSVGQAVKGRLVSFQQAGKIEFDLSNLGKGVYFVKIEGLSTSGVFRILKN